ncbi:MAG: GMC family oxidoreductase N-terminal domain-containing protein [Caldilineaceae bacterium]
MGGTTWHWLGTSLRHLPADFAIRSRYGVGVDWPISYADLEPWYGAAEAELGVAGDSEEDLGSPRSRDYPMPPLPLTYLDRQVATAADRLGLAVKLTPQARNSIAFDDRPPCCGNATCVPICPVAAKYDATVHVRKALAHGVQVIEQAVVTRVEVDQNGWVTGLRYKRPDGSERRVTARVYVLAANAIETPKLLLMSRTGRYHLNYVANQSDQVGRNLMTTRFSSPGRWHASPLPVPVAAGERRHRAATSTARSAAPAPPFAWPSARTAGPFRARRPSRWQAG